MRYSLALILTLLYLLVFTSSQSLKLTLAQFNCELVYETLADKSLYFNRCQSIRSEANQLNKSTWKQCVNICCGLTLYSYPHFNDHSLSKCYENNLTIQQTNNMIKIVVTSLSTIAAVAILIAFLQKIFQKCFGKKILPQTQQDSQKYTTDIKNPIWLQSPNQSSHATLGNFDKEQAEQCPICLEENANLVTTCKHRFHVHCLLAWFAKNRNCPLCKRTKIQQIKIQCKNCQGKHVLVSVNRAIKEVKEWLKFTNVCDSCNVSPKVRTRASTRDTSMGKFNCSKVFDDIQVIQL